MVELSCFELDMVSGGDAAFTRVAGQNSWGEWPTPAEEPSSFECFVDVVRSVLTGKRTKSGCL